MKSFALFILSALSLFSVGSAFKGCGSIQMNELCQDKIVDRCYTCIRVENDYRYPHPPVCVPVFQHNLGVLDNYPVDKWNCTMYHPTPVNPQVENDDEEDVEMMEKIANYLSDQDSDKISTELIKEDEAIDELTSEERFIKNVCTIDEFIFEMCHEQDNNGFCMIASFIHDMCNADGSSNDNSRVVSLESIETQGKLYSACTGSICRKEGWFYRGDHFGKEWCGMGKCKEYFGNRVLCDFPTNCGKKINALSVQSETFQREFETLGCGSEKFKCMLKKSCRNLVKQLDNCDKDLDCVYGVISSTDNKQFHDLVGCMFSQ